MWCCHKISEFVIIHECNYIRTLYRMHVYLTTIIMKYNIILCIPTYIIIIYKLLGFGCQIFVQFVYVRIFAFNNTIIYSLIIIVNVKSIRIYVCIV